ncbi:Bug family tripartite tricarboxylate transporter substrate binding protein [Ramlibacter albus]|uniref:Tripartite tricarboxylate transporter substrate binding protein n=1 Tax=Ramlibacter albus TaxID=2079448 RepID=A0A923M7D2_9BURK|nr:tripartite tricarboxylate transporter substrate binding protein [Ramlibacter albus]MBC5765106.1 tripartite tricarboxylate transporter substrate binding protein [Ramlibacter albus]
MAPRLVALALCLLSAFAAAQPYPAKPIRLVVPLQAGTATDTVARTLAIHVGQALGQPVVVENKAGADGAIGSVDVSKAAPDGYTILLATNSPMSAVPSLRKSPPYDPVADFTPITDIGRFTFFVVVHPSVPANTLKELLDYAKANPGKVTYASGNTTGIVTMAWLATAAGAQMVHVPYKGEPQAMPDLVAGRVLAMAASATTTAPMVREGKLRVLATTLPRRSPVLPDAPTIPEAGYPQFALTSWAGLFGPAKMPRDVVERLNREFAAVMGLPEVLATMEKHGFLLNPSKPAELGSLVKEQLENYRRVLAAAGVQPD